MRVRLNAENYTVLSVSGTPRAVIAGAGTSLPPPHMSVMVVTPAWMKESHTLTISFNFLPQRCSPGTCSLCSWPLCPFFSNRRLTKQRRMPWKEGKRKRHPLFEPPLSTSRCPLLARDKDYCFEQFYSRPKTCMEACMHQGDLAISPGLGSSTGGHIALINRSVGKCARLNCPSLWSSYHSIQAQLLKAKETRPAE
jgi:hypothetical protein